MPTYAKAVYSPTPIQFHHGTRASKRYEIYLQLLYFYIFTDDILFDIETGKYQYFEDANEKGKKRKKKN